MSTGLESGVAMEVTAENIGGIDRTSVRLEPGVNVLEGRNATNRTSFLQAVMAAFGSERSTLKGDADEGRVAVDAGESGVERRLRRRNGEVVFDGETFLGDPELADLFAFLLESNEARRAGKLGEDLREVIMRPIDTAEIRREIRALEEEKREIDGELAELDALAEEQADLRTERAEVEATIDAREDEIATLRAELDEAGADPDAASDDDALAELRSARARLEEIEFDLETERETRTELTEERDRVRANLEELEADAEDAPDRLAGRLEELRERKRALSATIGDLQSVITFNEDRLAEGDLGLEPAEEPGADVTDQLLEDAVTCWTCGSTVDRSAIEETVERLRTLHNTKLDERRELEERIEELSDRRASRREQAERRDRLAQREEAIESELAATAERIADLEDERDAQAATVADLEADLEEADALESVLETQRELTQVELELERHRERLCEIEERLEELEDRLDEREALSERRQTVSEELQERRGRVERIEADAVESFNEHMDAILGILEYANIDRIWIERREGTTSGPPGASRTAFELHVVRTSEDGTTYEDTVSHLSESEREVTGLVFALAGFLAHEVYETVPIMLLDSLEAIDSARIADLVAYFEDYVDCLVVALLPEDATALPDSYTYHREF